MIQLYLKPPKYKQLQYLLLQQDPNNDNQMLIPQMRFCESPHMWYFAGIMYGIKGKKLNKLTNKPFT